jgi:zinc protease
MAIPDMNCRAAWALLAALSLDCASATPSVRDVAPASMPERAMTNSPPIEEPEPPAPMDPAVRTGKLANGLTYYVLKRGQPEHRAALWLAVKAGSVVEDDDQRGIAHFVEHMAFNGTRRFAKGAIESFLERAGMTIGPDLNATTSLDRTVYQLIVPTDDRAVMYKGLDVLRDMAGDVTFDAKAVDKERGVVLEEWRLQGGADRRVWDQEFPVLTQGSRYAHRLPMGLLDTVKAATPTALAKFYQDWYRPELMAVIAVGDFEPAEMETEIEARFAHFSNTNKPRPGIEFPLPQDQDLTIAITTDPELQFTTVTVYDKVDHPLDHTKGDHKRRLVYLLYQAMLRSRLGEQVGDESSPFIETRALRGTLTSTVDVIIRSARVREGRIGDAIQLLFRGVAALQRDGFLPNELERTKKNLVADVERLAREEDKEPISELAGKLADNFVAHEPVHGRGVELAWVRELVPGITLEEVNALARARGGNKGRVIAIDAPTGAKVPTEANVRALVKAALDGPIERWQDHTLFEVPLIVTTPTPRSIVSSEHEPSTDVTVWRLANGVRVVVKPTTFGNDNVIVHGWQSGGTSLVSDEDFVHARFAEEFIRRSGVPGFSERSLHKALAGKVVFASAGLDERFEKAEAAARAPDLETMMQLLYLRLIGPRRDRSAFELWKRQALESARHRDDSPDQRFVDEIDATVTGHHPRRRTVTTEMIGQVDLARAYSIWKDRFDDFSGFTFVFVGNIDLARLQPLVETYLANLPSKGRHERWKDLGVEYPKGRVERTVIAGREQKGRVWIDFNGPAKWTLDGERDSRILEMVLGIRLREVLRQDMSGVYNVSVGAAVIREPAQRRTLSVSFTCAPENVDILREAVFTEIAAIARNGIGAAYLAKVVQQLFRQHEVDVKSNEWWLERLTEAYYFSDSFAQANDLHAITKRVTSGRIKATALRMFDPKQYVLAVLRPAPSPALLPKTEPSNHAASNRGDGRSGL